MENSSGLTPVGYTVLLKPYEVQEKTKGGIILPENKRDQMLLLDQRATVVAVSENCWVDEKAPRAVVGDKVVVSRMAGYLIQGTADGEKYRMVLDRDIIAVIEKEGADISYV